MKFFFLLTLVAVLFTNCTKTEVEPEVVIPSELYVGNYTVTETRTFTNTYTSQEETSIEQFLITISKVDDTVVEINGFGNCISSDLKANASESTLVVTDPPSSVCGTVGTYSPPSSIIITKTADGFNLTYNSDHYLQSPNGFSSTSVPTRTSGIAIKS